MGLVSMTKTAAQNAYEIVDMKNPATETGGVGNLLGEWVNQLTFRKQLVFRHFERLGELGADLIGAGFIA